MHLHRYMLDLMRSNNHIFTSTTQILLETITPSTVWSKCWAATAMCPPPPQCCARNHGVYEAASRHLPPFTLAALLGSADTWCLVPGLHTSYLYICYHDANEPYLRFWEEVYHWCPFNDMSCEFSLWVRNIELKSCPDQTRPEPESLL